MIKDNPQLHDLPLTQETPATQTSLETFNAYLNAPVTKLHADEYEVKDIDGFTESLLGSGNMNFLMMQAGQTDEAIANTNPFHTAQGDFSLTPYAFLPGGASNPAALSGGVNDLSGDRPFDMPGALEGFSGDGNGAESNAAGTLGASTAAANSQSVNPFSDSTSFSSAYNGSNGSNGNNGSNGSSGTSGVNGRDGEGGGSQTTIINNNTTNVTENTVIDNTVNLGDTNIEIINENLTEVVENIYNNTTDFLTEVVNNVTDIVNNTVNNIFDGNPLDIGPIGISLDAALDDLLDLDLDLINGDEILTVLDEVIDLSPVTNLVEGLTGDLVADLGLDVILDPFQYDNSPNDHDVHVGLDILDLGLPSIDVPLDTVEFLLGDVDIGLDLSEDILDLLPPVLGGSDNGDANIELGGLEPLGPVLDPVMGIVDGLFNPAEDLAGDIDIIGDLHLGLIGLGDNAPGPDTDITIPLHLDLLDSDILSDTIDINLDPVESLLGDIDLDAGIAGNLLGDTADGLIDTISGGTGTENILANIGDTVSDLLGGLLPGAESADTDLALGTNLGIPGLDLLGNGVDIVLNPVEDLAGDLDIAGDLHLDLLGIGSDQTGADTDIVIPLDLALIDNPILNDTLDVGLDPIEQIIGDVDLDVTAAGDLLGSTAPDLIDNINGGTGTDNLLSDVGTLLSETVDGILPLEGEPGDTDILLDADLEIPGLDLVPGTDLIDNAGEILLDPVENLLGDIDVTGTADIGVFDIGDAYAPTDTDLTVDLGGLAGIAEIPVDLGTAESIVGDIDLEVSVSQDVIDTLTNPGTLFENIAETVDNTIDTAINLLDSMTGHPGALDLGALLSSADGGGGGLSSWTETILPDAGSIFGDGLAGALGDILPDPVSASPVIPLPIIPVIPAAPAHGGGLFGHGGLFG